MATFNGDPVMVKGWVEKKQQLEVDLAEELLKIFNGTPELIGTMREMADKGLEEILILNDIAKGEDAKQGGSILLYKSIVDSMKAENKANMSILKTFGASKNAGKGLKAELPADLEKIRANKDTFTASECSDIVRLYGTVCEEAAKRDAKTFEDLQKRRTKDDEEWEKLKKTPQFKILQELHAKINAVGPVKDTIEKQKLLEALKSSFRKEPGDPKAVWNQDSSTFAYGRHRLNKKNPKQKSAYESQIATAGMSKVQQWLNAKGGGQSLFALENSSTIGKIDRVFGLVPAADISGTTADTMFYLTKMFDDYSVALDPVFFMLPLATIVAGAHHSLLEVALPLSLNGKIDYVIGKYSSLLPKGAKVGVDKIKPLLDKMEKDPRNRLMLVAHDDSKKPVAPVGAFVMEKSDSDEYYAFARGVDVLKKFKALPAWPNKAKVQELLDQMKVRVVNA
jgi:hypothetical protein